MSDVCTSGCRTRDHSSYAECLVSKTSGLRIDGVDAAAVAQRRWNTEIREYRAARKQGIQPKSTSLKDIRGAVRRSRAADTALQES